MNKNILAWMRAHVRREDKLGQAIVVIALILICLRAIMPVHHLSNGYVIYLYPWREFNDCYMSADCGIDRSRTFMESSAVALLAVGLLYTRHQRRR